MNYQEIKNKLHGPVFPIVTPFTKTGGLDFDSLKGYLDYLYEGGARNFYVMAYNSRFGVLVQTLSAFFTKKKFILMIKFINTFKQLQPLQILVCSFTK